MIRKRQSMKRKAAKKLLAGLSGTFSDLQAGKVETAKFEDKELYLFDESIEFVKDENGIYPFLGGSYLDSIPKVVVDMGAIRFVCNGADVMAPGITEIGSFDEGDLVVIRDINHGKALAIGIANKSSADIEASKKGKVIKNLHYVGDKLWGAVS
ncbi:RNA-binding protein [Candidatus Bathyarchaeota archaeon]|nr:RNA-binding protein [Candidatus Bathyarchaeota archaeon]MBT4320228.1 RNA-binding protein [Candidatus Bathyarchaeota archaeon]MBT4423397.1 RNA-binding protein [Candidatus Bathyarchaeota archaeon]MBT5641584.1 RNA-binding protein [Candidatus Bathyarchaeota archaeon]MBT6604697.1 RNA-binding protein [Candidatus Bathyarchaeota archaeon]